MDPDRVELSNLHRQILYSLKDIERLKVERPPADNSKKYFLKLNQQIPEAFNHSNAEKIFSQYDLIIDGLDRLEKKFALNDWCVKLKIPSMFMPGL